MVDVSACPDESGNFFLFASFLCISLLFLTVFSPSAKAHPERITIHIYGSRNCIYCKRIKSSLFDTYARDSIVFHSLSENSNAVYFRKIYSDVFPKKEKDLPLVGIFEDGELLAVVGGYEDEYLKPGFWKDISEEPVLSYYEGENFRIENPELVERLMLQKTEPTSSSFRNLIVPVAVAAIADAVNPCAFSLFIVFLTLLVTRLNKNIAKVGLSFILAVFVAYFLFGLGLKQFFVTFSFLKYGVAVFGAFVGILQMSDLFLKHGITLTPDVFKQRLQAEMENAPDLSCPTCGTGQSGSSFKEDLSEGVLGKITSPVGTFVLGLFTSALLLPCTSGPYFVAVNFISKSPGFGLPLLFIYNSIFVLPFVAILLGIRQMTLKTLEVKKWWRERSEIVGFVAGTAIFILSVFLFFS